MSELSTHAPKFQLPSSLSLFPSCPARGCECRSAVLMIMLSYSWFQQFQWTYLITVIVGAACDQQGRTINPSPDIGQQVAALGVSILNHGLH